MAARFGKNDRIFLAVLSLMLSVGAICFFFSGKNSGAFAKVTVDGELYGAYPLEKEKTIQVIKEGRVVNVLKMENGMADMITADCPDKLCVHQKAVSKAGETIVCLPNRVVVEVTGGNKAALDAMT